jgi:hypothetical protein
MILFIKRLYIISSLILFAGSGLLFAQEDPGFKKQQSKKIVDLAKNEKKTYHLKNIINIVDTIDETYADLFLNLKTGKKITIFFDPAHGRLSN